MSRGDRRHGASPASAPGNTPRRHRARTGRRRDGVRAARRRRRRRAARSSSGCSGRSALARSGAEHDEPGDPDLPVDVPAALRPRPKQQPVPVLAAALPVLSKDKLSYTVQLRKGVRFNDGTPFNAKAVVTSVQRLMNHPQSSRKSDYTSVASVTRVRAVHRRLPAEGTGLRAFLANPCVFSPTQLAKLGDDFGASPVCVGPFMFDHRVAGDNVTLVKSPYYYDQKHVYLDKIVFRPMPDRGRRGGRAEGGRHPGARLRRDDGAAGRAADLEPARDPGAPARLARRAHQHRQQERSSTTAVRERRHAARDEREAAAGVRGGDRPRRPLNRVVFGGLVQPSCTLSRRRTPPGSTRRRSRARRTTPSTRGSSSPSRASRIRPCTCSSEHDRQDRGSRSSSRRRRRRSGSTS